MAVKHTSVPTFVMNSKYDPALLGISEGNPKGADAINEVCVIEDLDLACITNCLAALTPLSVQQLPNVWFVLV